MKKSIIFFLILTVVWQTQAQPRAIRKLPLPLNQPSLSSYAPYISFDGNAIVFLNDYTDDGSLAMQFSKRVGADWTPLVTQPRTFTNMVNFIKGYTLSPDGQTLFLTSQLSNGVGGYDIYACALKGNIFAAPANLGMPVNSKQHDGTPTITADGLTMYFMRCESMSSQQADRCKIMVSKKQPGGRWGDAVELPLNINTGNSQTPRIMADGETLIFASNKLQPNKGGMDLYESKWDGQTWSNPVPLDFVNTPQDDQFVSVTGQGQYLLRDSKAERRTELTEYLFPVALKPKAILRVDGKLDDTTLPVYISVNNLSTNKRVFNGRPLADGSFTTFLAEGSRYEVSVEPENGNVIFSSRFFDLTQGVSRPFERYTAKVKTAEANDEIILSAITFKPNSTEIEKSAQNELRRLSRLVKSMPDLALEIQVELQGYLEDSIRSSPDLTEQRIDSVEYYIDEIDSLGQLYQKDTIVAEFTYHNDRTQKQAEAVLDELAALGCDRNKLFFTTVAKPEAILEERKLIIKAVLRKK